MSDAQKSQPRVLAVVTDSAASEFVRQAEQGISRRLLPANWRLKYVEAGTLSYPGRLALLKQAAMSGDYAAVLYVHLLLTQDQAEIFRQAKIPLGFLAGHLEGVDSVMADDSEGAYQAGRHLLDLGHRRLALVSPPLAAGESFLRSEGFQRALAERHLELGKGMEIILPDHSAEAGADAARALLKLREKPTAAFVSAGDLAARGFVEELKKGGLQVPREMSVIGYDDLPLAEAMEPALSSVRQPLEAMAMRITEVLIQAVTRPGARSVIAESFSPELVLRLSTTVPKR